MAVNTILLTQARSGSTRLPGKVLMEINCKSLLQIHIERLQRCRSVSEIIVATTSKEEDDIIFNKAAEFGVSASRGSESDVLDRFYQAVKGKNADWVVRVTSDCPLIDPELIDNVVEYVQMADKDYGSNTMVEEYPDGQDVEVFKFSALQAAWENASLTSEREHVTPYIRNNSDIRNGKMFTSINYPCEFNYSNIRMTVDEIKDFELIEILINEMGTNRSWKEYTEFIVKNELFKINNSINRNEGLTKSLQND